jgi:hypothetical protein
LWENYGMHQERGKESIAHLVKLYAGHDLNHLGQMEKIVEGGSQVRGPLQPRRCDMGLSWKVDKDLGCVGVGHPRLGGGVRGG